MVSTGALVVVAALHVFLSLSFFIEQDADLCSAAATIASWIFLIGLFDILWAICVFPPRYAHLPSICQSIWEIILHVLIANPSPEVQHRGVVVILNMINAGEDITRKIFDTDIMELLNGLSQLPDDTRSKAREVAAQCLTAAERYRIIEKSDEGELPDVFKEAAREQEIEEE